MLKVRRGHQRWSPLVASMQVLRRVRHCLIALSIIRWSVVKFIADSRDTLAQLINIVYLHLAHLLLKYRPDFIINRIQIRTVRRPECWQDESWCFSRKKINCFLRTMSWRVVLIKDKVFGNVAHVWKQFFLEVSL